jgi:hypothetical protein
MKFFLNFFTGMLSCESFYIYFFLHPISVFFNYSISVFFPPRKNKLIHSKTTTMMEAQVERSRAFLEKVESMRKDARACLLEPAVFEYLDQMEERAIQFVAVYNQLG